MTSANIGDFEFRIGDSSSPEVFTKVAEVLSISPFGRTNPLLPVTNFDSGGSQEYIAGLADGDEVTLEVNFIGGNTSQQDFAKKVRVGTNFNIQIVYTGASPNLVFASAVTPIRGAVAPSATEQNRRLFAVKLSGDPTTNDFETA